MCTLLSNLFMLAPEKSYFKIQNYVYINIALYPVHWTAQRASCFTQWQTRSFQYKLDFSKVSSHAVVTMQKL